MISPLARSPQIDDQVRKSVKDVAVTRSSRLSGSSIGRCRIHPNQNVADWYQPYAIPNTVITLDRPSSSIDD